MTMTAKDIQRRLRFLDDYEQSLRHNIWDDPDRVSDELIKILNARSKLQKMLIEADDHP